MARVYATTVQYETWTGETAPANVDRLLRTASRLVDRALIGVVYDTDSAGMPTDPDVAEAMADATCAIAQHLDATGALGAGGSGDSEQWDSLSIGNVSLTRSSDSTSSTGGPEVDGVALPLDAVAALRSVGDLVVMVR